MPAFFRRGSSGSPARVASETWGESLTSRRRPGSATSRRPLAGSFPETNPFSLRDTAAKSEPHAPQGSAEQNPIMQTKAGNSFIYVVRTSPAATFTTSSDKEEKWRSPDYNVGIAAAHNAYNRIIAPDYNVGIHVPKVNEEWHNTERIDAPYYDVGINVSNGTKERHNSERIDIISPSGQSTRTGGSSGFATAPFKRALEPEERDAVVQTYISKGSIGVQHVTEERNAVVQTEIALVSKHVEAAPDAGSNVGVQTEIIRACKEVEAAPDAGSNAGVQTELIRANKCIEAVPNVGSNVGVQAELIKVSKGVEAIPEVGSNAGVQTERMRSEVVVQTISEMAVQTDVPKVNKAVMAVPDRAPPGDDVAVQVDAPLAEAGVQTSICQVPKGADQLVSKSVATGPIFQRSAGVQTRESFVTECCARKVGVICFAVGLAVGIFFTSWHLTGWPWNQLEQQAAVTIEEGTTTTMSTLSLTDTVTVTSTTLMV